MGIIMLFVFGIFFVWYRDIVFIFFINKVFLNLYVLNSVLEDNVVFL